MSRFQHIIMLIFDKFLDDIIDVLQLLLFYLRYISFFTHSFTFSCSCDVCSENSSQKHPFDLRNIQTVNSVFDVYFDAVKYLELFWAEFV